MSDTVLVTGGTGFIAQHCVVQLLSAGYEVRTTVRSPERVPSVMSIIASNVSETVRADLADRLRVVTADLLSDNGWLAATHGCRYVVHVASPLPLAMPKNEQDLIAPARDGTLRVLRAANDNGVARVVLTSSIAAVGYGRDRNHLFTEDDWSNVESPSIDAYAKSKTLAERAAWRFVGSLTGEKPMEMVTINPGLVLGPLLSDEWSSSGEAVKKLLDHAVPGVPDLVFPPVDVRDVAGAHVTAMTSPLAAGQRYLCALESVPLRAIALVLAEHYTELGYKIPTRRIPKAAVRVAALFDRDLRGVVNDIGKPFRIDPGKIARDLDFKPRGLAEMTISMAESMIRFSVVRDRSR